MERRNRVFAITERNSGSNRSRITLDKRPERLSRSIRATIISGMRMCMAKARIAVVGAGLMGHGIAQVFATAGHDVTITDAISASLDTVKARISANLNDLGDDPAAVDRVTPEQDLATAVRAADYV